ncbi:factor-independent urate hydroxylase [Paenibacillus cellulositrophicus]|uniref:factor-independent urate hydroxylase n=1 Tax=Paenibacillus cellulositrophicus TaxID=562959 RepID=UPI0012678313|nr:urate oxidase [Paenibacillus cellulositrophicus]
MLKINSGRTLYYGKGDVLVYRTYAEPLEAAPIPESPFVGEDNILFAHNIRFAVSGDALLTSFTDGDNAQLVATDSMKNFILRQAATFAGGTTEALLHFLAVRFMETYGHIDTVRLSANRIPFLPLPVPGPGGFLDNRLVYRRSYNDHASAEMKLARGAEGYDLDEAWSGLSDLQLIKVSGSSFYGFICDEYTTLPDAYDRPLFIFLDIRWRYEDPQDAIHPEVGKHVPVQQIRDIAQNVFYEFATPSIQHLIWLIGQRILIRFPQLAEVRFETSNRTWETVVEPADGLSSGVFTEPRPPFGFQGFSMTREDLIAAPEPAEGTVSSG